MFRNPNLEKLSDLYGRIFTDDVAESTDNCSEIKAASLFRNPSAALLIDSIDVVSAKHHRTVK